MAEKYIINMPLKSTPDDTDLMIIEDAQDTKRMTWANVVKPIEDLIDTTVAAHLAESASKHIHSSGSNANGSYIKFDDGTMICYVKKEFSVTTTSVGVLFRYSPGTQLFPATFLDTPSISASWGLTALWANDVGGTNTGYVPVAWSASAVTDSLREYRAIIIGRWK